MQVVALISGGKDSTFNMMKCIEDGHQVVALANLYPGGGAEELDSYMYQSVGHNLIEAYATCMELPLYRCPIRGRPVNQEYDYQPTESDEVECLYELLLTVSRHHPEVRGVSSGAIHSAYQRNRVENVCQRLGWTSLAYLWAAPQGPLLDEMLASNIKAIIIKVAVYGLSEIDLGRELGEMRPKLDHLHKQMGINVCGEGGEFETLTLDCPLFRRHRIVLDEVQVVVHKESALASVSYLKILKWHLEEKVL